MIGICLIGCGRAGMIHARNFAGKVLGARMVAVVDPVPEAMEAAKAELGAEHGFTDYRDALALRAVDAVVIVSPTKFHCEIALAAADAGKHILCEKPMAMNEAECQRMIDAAERNRVKLQIGFMRRFDESFLAAKALVDQGEIGDVVLVKCHTRGPSVPKPWMYDLNQSNGALAEVSSHDIDTMRWFTGSDFQEMYAVGGNYRCPDARASFPDFYDSVILSARFRSGAQGQLDGAQGVGYGYDCAAEIVGSKGCLKVCRSQEQFLRLCTTDGQMRTPFVSSWRTLFTDAYLAEDADFARCVQRDEPVRVTGLDGLMAVRAVHHGNLSIVEKRIVTL